MDKKLLFLPLGGAGEIGMNLNLYGYEDQWLMVDLGVTFHDRLGIEILMPNPQFITERKDKLAGLLLTHGHEDHIGAVPYLWERLKCPIYATPFTAELVRHKMQDHQIDSEKYLHVIPLKGSMDIGPFNIEMVTLTHSIPEPNGVLITTPVGKVFHTGDWKIDPKPLVGEAIDEITLKRIGDEGVLAMVCDSTNVFFNEPSGSESDVRDNLFDLIGGYTDGSIFVTCFASNLARLETVALAAQHHGRQVVLLGRGFHRMNDISRKLGYISSVHPFIHPSKAKSLPRDKVLYLCSGSQGEYRAALNRIASETHPDIKMSPKDVVVFSSRVIPGNEKQINAIKNKIIKLGVRVVNENPRDIHVSGHPGRQDLLKMYEWVRPKTLIPVHGEAIHMVEQARLGKKAGIPHVVVPDNGSLIEITASGVEIVDEVPAGRLALDGTQLISLNHGSLRDRYKIGTEGVGSVVVHFDGRNNLIGVPEVVFQGLSVSGDLEKEAVREVSYALESLTGADRQRDELIKDKTRLALQKVIQEGIGRRPVVITHVVREE